MLQQIQNVGQNTCQVTSSNTLTDCDNCVKDMNSCDFCGADTNFEDNKHFYCIDCYVKLRNSAHTHDLPVNPQPLTPITPFPDRVNVPYVPYNPMPGGTTITSESLPLPYTFIC